MGYDYDRAAEDYWSDPDGAIAELAAYEIDRLTSIPRHIKFRLSQIETDRGRKEMPVRPTRPGPATARTRKPAAAPARTPRAKRNPLAEYVSKEATAYQKAFARWLVEEVGYEPTSKKDFLAAIRLAITTRNLFNSSDWIEEWRERTGEVKRGPKPKAAAPAAPARGKRKPEPEPEEEFDEEEEAEEEFDSEDSDDDFDEDDTEESDEDDWEDEEEVEEEEEPAPAPKPHASRAQTAAKSSTRGAAPARKAAPAPAKKAPAKRPAKPAADDDDFVF